MFALMYEDGLGHAMSGAETAPKELGEVTTSRRVLNTRHVSSRLPRKTISSLQECFYVVTAHSPQGYARPAAQIVQSYAPIGTKQFGDERGAVLALDAKYRLDGVSRMQHLHDLSSEL